MKAHLKRYWLTVVLIIGILYVFFSSDYKLDQYEVDISTRDDSIINLNALNGALQIELQLLDSSLIVSEGQNEGFEATITDLKRKRIEDKKKHDEEIADIVSIPADSLYKLVTGRLN